MSFSFLTVDFHMIQLPEVEVCLKVLLLIQEFFEAFRFFLLLSQGASFSLHSLLFVVTKHEFRLGFFLGFQSFFIGRLEFGTKRNLLQQLDKFSWTLAGQRFDIALKD
mmetsp:Transcript_24722/g.70918  ORF Transcript_24722/g.70918 Transcript_24722/m.70918 type:complete len:108 (+) Transcript_24722:2032-2355(+)